MEISSLKKSLKYVNNHIYAGENLDQDQIHLEDRLCQVKDRSWFLEQDNDSKWVEYEGQMTSQFLHLEDIKQNAFLETLQINDSLISDITIVLSEINTFYSDLYSCKDQVTELEIDKFLNSLINLPHIVDDTTAQRMEISEKEVEKAIDTLKSRKAPGSDELTTAFYKSFKETLSRILCKVLDDAFQNKTLTTSQCLAIIILLFKKGDSHILPNYRPISLTNTDYKILTYLLTA